MHKERGLLVIVVIIAIFFSISSVYANFACGQVKATNSDISSSWIDVKVFYPENDSFYTICQVSPENGKYCCNLDDITEINWSVGKNVSSKIDLEGYFSNPVSLITTGNGYDIFSDLYFDKIFKLKEFDTIYSKSSSVNIAGNTNNLQGNINYALYKDDFLEREGEYCSNCTFLNINFSNLTFGFYKLNLSFSSLEDIHSEQFYFSVLDNFSLERKISCQGCNDFKIPSSNRLVLINLTLNSSEKVIGYLYDTFPKNWLYKGPLQPIEKTSTHNMIRWYINDSQSSVSYALIPPRDLFNSLYIFKAGFENLSVEKDKVLLSKYSFLNFFKINKPYSFKDSSIQLFNNLAVDSKNPIVLSSGKGVVTNVAIFVSEPMKNVFSFVGESNSLKLDDADYNFVIWTSVPPENVLNVLSNLRIEKSKLSSNSKIHLFYYDYLEGIWSEKNISKINDDEMYFYYKFLTNKTGVYSILINE